MDIQKAAYAFVMNGDPVSCERFGGGHINQTYLVQTDTGSKYVLQHINKHVFKNPPQLMENANGVTSFIRNQGGFALTFLTTADGSPCYCDEQGEFWRSYEYVGGLCLEAAETADDFYQSGLAFGQFQNQLSDYPAETLYETIPNFHNTPDRFRQLKEAIAENRSGRLDTCKPEVEFFLANEALGKKLAEKLSTACPACP